MTQVAGKKLEVDSTRVHSIWKRIGSSWNGRRATRVHAGSWLGTRVLFAAGAACVLVFCGCDRGPAMSQVSGKVLLTNGTVPKGGVRVVRFQPAEGSTAQVRKGASGAIGEDGAFQMWTQKPGDGVYHGDYLVTVAVLKGAMDPTPMISPKYVQPDTTPYKVTVDGDISDLKLEVEPLSGAGS